MAAAAAAAVLATRFWPRFFSGGEARFFGRSAIPDGSWWNKKREKKKEMVKGEGAGERESEKKELGLMVVHSSVFISSSRVSDRM